MSCIHSLSVLCVDFRMNCYFRALSAPSRSSVLLSVSSHLERGPCDSFFFFTENINSERISCSTNFKVTLFNLEGRKSARDLSPVLETAVMMVRGDTAPLFSLPCQNVTRHDATRFAFCLKTQVFYASCG